MPLAELPDVHLNYELEGSEEAPVLVLSNSLGSDLSMWAMQMPALLTHFRVLRYDTRGHGKSGVPQGDYTVEQLGGDVIGLLDHLGITHAHFCGISMGGLTGMWLALHHPQRVRRLVLANTAARLGSDESWQARINAVRSEGMAALAPAIIERWYTPAYKSRCAAALEPTQKTLATTSADGYASCCAALRDADLRDGLVRIALPTLVIAGTYDSSTPPSDGRAIAAKIDGAHYVELDAAHISNQEQAGAFTGAVLSFLTDGAINDRARHAAGMSVRRAVLGDAHVDRAQGGLTDANREFQDLITRYAWGEIWTRPGLPRHTRSLLTIGLMVALNRPDELKLHLRAAANNGVSTAEIKEVLLQCAIYAGVPAANAAFHLMGEVLGEANSSSGMPEDSR
jgi:3-oxoadipate enol-lactonase/4-carboxymuconolactone decarboxylase